MCSCQQSLCLLTLFKLWTDPWSCVYFVITGQHNYKDIKIQADIRWGDPLLSGPFCEIYMDE